MKKVIATITTACVLAVSQGHAVTNLIFDTTADELIFFSDSSGNMVTTLPDGYVATFWWSQTGAEGSFTALGMAGFLDVSTWNAGKGNIYDGGFIFNSGVIVPAAGGENCYVMMRIFQMPDIADYLLTHPYLNDKGVLLNDGSFGGAVHAEISGLWTDALALWESGVGGDIGEYVSDPIKATSAGGVAFYIVDSFTSYGWDLGDTVYLKAPTLVPEPSTWLLLGAGAAFVVVMRRRTK